MTALYRPVLIESAEQAEALPEGTIATSPEDYPAEKFQGGWANDAQAFDHRQMVGWSALVPVEAEEETVRSLHLDGRLDGHTFEEGDELPEHFYDGPPRTRLVTPWEEA